LSGRVSNLSTASPEERREVVGELAKDFLARAAQLGKSDAMLAMRVARGLEESDKQLAIKAYTDLGRALADSSDENTARTGKLLQGAGRRIDLAGKARDRKGRTRARK